MKYIRKYKKRSITFLITLLFFLLISSVFGRYIHNIISQYLLETMGFYFNSSILNPNGKNYYINNWDGVNTYTLTIDLNNRKNAERYTKTDISYTINVNCPNTVTCTLSKSSGVIHPTDETDSYQISVTPLQNFYENDTVRVETSVSSSVPYHKTMTATYTIGVEKSNFSYEIEDSVNSKYLIIRFLNSISYYQVEQAFLDYQIGDQINLDDYNDLTEENKEKCFSAIVTVQYNPELLFVDMTNSLYLKHLPTNYQEQTIKLNEQRLNK